MGSRAGLTALLSFVVAAAGAAPHIDERMPLCWTCHGERGQSSQPMVPSLGGQPAFFLLTQLFLFREGRRGGPMIEIARGWSDDELRAFSDRIAQLPPPNPPGGAPDPARLTRARALVVKRHCNVCHNDDYSGRDQMPRLASQREDYLLKAMREFRSGTRLGYGAAMTRELAGLEDRDLQDLAHFLAHVPPAGNAGR